MKKSIRRYIAITLALTVTLSSSALADTANGADGAAIKVVTEQFFDTYMDAMVLKDHPDFSDIFKTTTNTDLYRIMIDYEVDNAIVQSAGFRSYEYDLNYTSLSINGSSANVKLMQDATIHFESFPADVPSHRNLTFEFDLQKSDGAWKIINIDSNHIIFTGFLDGLNASSSAKLRASDVSVLADAEAQAKAWLPALATLSDTELTLLREGDVDSQESVRKIADEVAGADESTMPMAANSVKKDFSIATAKAYADKYYSTYNSGTGLFKKNSSDCQNFLSQIVWAGYGGWADGDSVTTMKANIKSRLRMYYNNGDYTTTWYGNDGGGSGPWENVEWHWDFLASDHTYGPQGNQYNDQELYNRLAVTSIYEGDGLQVRNGPNGNKGTKVYDHSVFVVYHSPNPYVYSAIGVAAHTTNYQNEPLTTIIAGFGNSNCYMRAITYKQATFES